MTTIYLIRHGQASFGAESYDKLSEKGELQAQRLGQYFKHILKESPYVVAGSMHRHQQTAQLALAEFPQVTTIAPPIQVIDTHDGVKKKKKKRKKPKMRTDMVMPNSEIIGKTTHVSFHPRLAQSKKQGRRTPSPQKTERLDKKERSERFKMKLKKYLEATIFCL